MAVTELKQAQGNIEVNWLKIRLRKEAPYNKVTIRPRLSGRVPEIRLTPRTDFVSDLLNKFLQFDLILKSRMGLVKHEALLAC
jgi:hypothetical protein